MNDAPQRPMPLAAIVIAVVLVAVLAYPLGIGPAAWAVNSSWCPDWLDFGLQVVYAPLEWLAENGPDWLRDAVETYADWWISEPAPRPCV